MRRKLVHFSGAPVRQIYPVAINLRLGPRWLPPFHAKANRSHSDNGSPELGSEITLG